MGLLVKYIVFVCFCIVEVWLVDVIVVEVVLEGDEVVGWFLIEVEFILVEVLVVVFFVFVRLECVVVVEVFGVNLIV